MTRLLVVDDEYDVRAAIAMVLRVRGFEVVGIESGVAALIDFEESNYDLAIVDFFLQGAMDGFDVIRSMRERAPNIPIIAISGVTALDFLLNNPDLADVICLPKPFRPNELMNAIEAAFQARPPQ